MTCVDLQFDYKYNLLSGTIGSKEGVFLWQLRNEETGAG